MDQHQRRSRSSSRSELAHRPASISVSIPHKAHASRLNYTLRAPPSPSASVYPSSSLPSHRHSPLPAHTSTPHCNEANTLLPPHYITPPPLLTPRRISSHLPSPLITPSPVLPTLATMSPQVLVPPPIPQPPSLQDQLRSASRSERLLRETLRRDRAASLSPRTRSRHPESSSGRVASTSSEMFHCACTDSDEEGDEHLDNALHVSLLFVNPPQHQQNFAPPLQRASKSSADVRPKSRRPEPHLKEKERIPSVIPINASHRRPVPQSQPESFMYGAPMTQVRDRCPDRDPTWSSPESSSLSSPTSSHRQALTPSPSPPSYAPLPETHSHITSPRGRARNHTHPSANLPSPPHHHAQLHYHGHGQQATPPPTPPAFDARNASAKLRSIDGYVSFANVEGLGGPPGVDEGPTEEEKRRGSWWLWRGRSRSGSLGTAP